MFLQAIAVIVGLNLIAYLIAWKFQTDKLTDLTYNASFFIATFYLFLNSDKSIVQILLFIMIACWSLRLGFYLFRRVHKMGRDSRFDEMRPSWISFGKFWLLQTGSIIILILPVLFFYTKPAAEWSIFSSIGFGIWLLGFLIEAIADFQKSQFKSKSKNKGLFIQSGLWKKIRHPNYLGEILVWLGIFIFCIPHLSGMEWIAIISPLWITTLLIGISGIPLLKKDYERKYGHLDSYQKYVKESKLLIPGIY